MNGGIILKSVTLGVLAHVDAGKTTLIEALLYNTNMIRKLGRVDHKDAFLDTDDLEKMRGITIYSKQAFFEYEDTRFYILDTPGHVDFSTQLESNVKVMDYAILVVSGVDKVQSHTRTLWNILKKNNIPVFVFVNKMDRDVDKEEIMACLKNKLSDNCIDFSDKDEMIEEVAATNEELMEIFFDSDNIDYAKWFDIIADKICNREVFPCFFGSALYDKEIKRFIEYINKLTVVRNDGNSFEKLNIVNNNIYNNIEEKNIGRVFRILHDNNNRITFFKVLNGIFRVKDVIGEEKINQIRIYNGNKFSTVNEVSKGCLCAVTGINNVKIGDMIIDNEVFSENTDNSIVPVLKSKVIINDSTSPNFVLDAFKILEDEDPMLMVEWNEILSEIHISIMGKIQLEVLKEIVDKRFGYDVDFGKCEVVYKETVKKSVMGVGHFEPLRHYSEAHIKIIPDKLGSGITVSSECKNDVLDKNYQNSIMHSLSVKEHKGILIGVNLTDVKLVLNKGRSHLKHTEGGDFYEASTRAVRQGLFILGEDNMELLEPFYLFEIDVPMDYTGKVMSDISKMYGEFEEPSIANDRAIIKGKGPVVTFMEYPMEVASFSKGEGKVGLSFCGYFPCHNKDEVIESVGYDKERDTSNPSFSVFCSHGAGFNVAWNEVYDYAHLEIDEV